MVPHTETSSPGHLRLLVVVNVVRPDLGGGVLFSDLFEGLAERGAHVTVKCAYSYYPEWKDKSGKNGWKIRTSFESGVHMERHGLFIPRNPNSFLQRLLYEASFYLSLRRNMPQKDSFDAILVFCPLIGAVAYATAVRRRTRAPLWINVQDLSAQAAAAGGITARSSVGGLLLRIQNYFFAKADVWSSISSSMIAALERNNPAGIPVRLVPNWLHASLAHHIRAASGPPLVDAASEPPATKSASELNAPVRTDPEDDLAPPPRPLRLLYSGNIGAKQDLISFCRALSKTTAEFRFRIQAAGGRACELETWIASADDDRFSMHPLSNEEGLAKALAECDFYVITERAESGNSFIPSKLIPAIASLKPVLAVCDADSPLGREMEEHGLGPRLDWSDLSSLTATVSNEIRTSEGYQNWRRGCIERSRYYDRDTAISRCMDLIEELAASQGN